MPAVASVTTMAAMAFTSTPSCVVAGRDLGTKKQQRLTKAWRTRVPHNAKLNPPQASATNAPETAFGTTPTVLFDHDFVGPESSHDNRIENVKNLLTKWAQAVETGATNEVSTDAIDAAEWIRQFLTMKMEKSESQLPRAQSKLASNNDLNSHLLMMVDFGSVHASYALRSLCERNGTMCAKVAKLGAMDSVKNALAGDNNPSVEFECATAALCATLVSRNDDVHRLVAKSRLVPVILQRLLLPICDVDGGVVGDVNDVNTSSSDCDPTCNEGFCDFRGSSAADHFSATISDLSHNSAQQKLLLASGTAESMLSLLASTRMTVRINAACALANLVGREESDERMEADPTIVEEIVETLRAALDEKRIDGHRYETHKVTKSIANLATNDANKGRIFQAGALPLLVRGLQEPQEPHSSSDETQFWAATCLWNLSFDDTLREKVLEEPGVIESLEEARRGGSDETMRKAKGALWMIHGEQDSNNITDVTHETLQKLNGEGTVQNATGQVMLSYEWRMQAQVMRLRDELMGQGFTVWMDVDRMMGSTLEAMAIAIEQSDAIVMCVTHRYKESQACRTEAEYAYTKKKPLIPVMMEKNYSPDGWLGIIMGSKLYYNMHTIDEMQASLPGVVGEVLQVRKVNGGGKNGAAPAAVPAPPPPSNPSANYSSGGSSSTSTAEANIKTPMDHDAVAVWLDDVGLGEYAEAFRGARLFGKSLQKFHQEIGYHDPAEEKYHDKFKKVLGITSYGDRLLLLAELEALFGEIKWRI